MLFYFVLCQDCCIFAIWNGLNSYLTSVSDRSISIFSSAFRRLQNKTQVFPLPGSIFVHNRLTHSLEVSSVGMSLGNDISKRIIEKRPELKDTLFEEIGTIVSAACLAHDLGNPPFGHSGEKAIQTFFSEGAGKAVKELVSPEFWQDITHFEGNANAFRILTHQFKGRRKGGFVMTYSMLASIVKYPFASQLAGSHGKFGFFTLEKDSYQKVADELGIFCKSKPGEPLRYARHPLVYMVEAADDISTKSWTSKTPTNSRSCLTKRRRDCCWDSSTRKPKIRLRSESRKKA